MRILRKTSSPRGRRPRIPGDIETEVRRAKGMISNAVARASSDVRDAIEKARGHLLGVQRQMVVTDPAFQSAVAACREGQQTSRQAAQTMLDSLNRISGMIANGSAAGKNRGA